MEQVFHGEGGGQDSRREDGQQAESSNLSLRSQVLYLPCPVHSPWAFLQPTVFPLTGLPA